MNIRERIKNNKFDMDLAELKSNLLDAVSRCGYTTKEEIGKLVETELRNHENLNISSYDLQKLITFLVSSVNAFEIITDIFDNDEEVDTIFVNSLTNIVAEYKSGIKDLNLTIADGDKFVEEILKNCTYIKDDRDGIIDAVSPTGVRFHIMLDAFNQSVPIMVIKKFKPQIANFQSLIDNDFIIDKMADFLSLAISAHRNIIVKGLPNSGKTTLLNALVSKSDYIVVGGGMANTFLNANGNNVGKSLKEEQLNNDALNLLKLAKEKNCEIILPIDVITAKEISENQNIETKNIRDILDDDIIVDVGPKTIDIIKNKLDLCKVIIWNGPIGIYEISPFNKGTDSLAKIIANKTSDGSLKSVAGGGDILAALNKANIAEKFTYLSTAGGAFLKWLEKGVLPAVEKLMIK